MTIKHETEKSVRYFTPLPGNPNVAVSHSMYMKPEFRGRGFAKQEQYISLTQMRLSGFKYAICTVAEENHAQQKVLQDTDWRQLDRFYDDCMEHTVIVFGRRV